MLTDVCDLGLISAELYRLKTLLHPFTFENSDVAGYGFRLAMVKTKGM